MARALDVVGDRWTLLIVRELLISGPRRFVELQRGLPGIATNLLTQRLRDLEDHGVITRDLPSAGAGSAVYGLTRRGRALDGVLRELLKWGAPTVPQAPADAIFQMHWLSQPARYLLTDHHPEQPATIVRFGTLDDGFDLTVGSGRVTVAPPQGNANPQATVAGPGPVLVALLQGAIDLPTAELGGVEIEGDPTALTRALPSTNVPDQYN